MSPSLRLHPTAPYVVVTSYYSRAVELRHIETGATIVVTPPWARQQVVLAPIGAGTAAGWRSPPGTRTRLAIYGLTTDPPALRLIRSMDRTPTAGRSSHFNEAGDRLLIHGWTAYLRMFDVESGQPLFTTRSFGAASRATSPYSLQVDRAGRRLFPGSGGRAGPSVRLLVGRRGAGVPAPGPLLDQGPGRVFRPSTLGGRMAVVAIGRRPHRLRDWRAGRELGHVRENSTGEGRSSTAGVRLVANFGVGVYRLPVRDDPHRARLRDDRPARAAAPEPRQPHGGD